MFKKYITSALVGLLVHIGGTELALAKPAEEKEARHAQKVKECILKLGVGPEAFITLTLRDKTQLKGYISKVGGDSFIVTEVKTGTETAVDYPQVRTAKGNNLSTGAKVAIGVGIGVAIALLIFFRTVD